MTQTSNSDRKQVLVIGAGPGGYVAAIRAAQLGAKVSIVEKSEMGGTCLNVGCIPTKALLHTAELYKEILESSKIGIDVSSDVKINWKNVQKRKKIIVKKMTAGVRSLLQMNGVEIIKGIASFLNDKEIQIQTSENESIVLQPDAIIIATGSYSIAPRVEGGNLERVIDSTGALSLDSLPKDIIVLGGGVIGVEFANLFQNMGVKVTISSRQSGILSSLDSDISVAMQKTLEKSGMSILTSASAKKIEAKDERLIVTFEQNGEEKQVEAEYVLSSAGRGPYTENLGLDKTSLEMNGKFIGVDTKMQTNLPHIYAIGDVTGKSMLAHVASEQGIVAAETIMGLHTEMHYHAIPSCVYTDPEIAFVGLTETEAKQQGFDVVSGIFPLGGNGKSLIMNRVNDTFVKVVFEKNTDKILGMHMFGPRATDLIIEGTMAISMGATFDDFYKTIHPHPTVCESIKEAVLDVKKIAIHKLEL